VVAFLFTKEDPCDWASALRRELLWGYHSSGTGGVSSGNQALSPSFGQRPRRTSEEKSVWQNHGSRDRENPARIIRNTARLSLPRI
jgi:hypothetical protein